MLARARKRSSRITLVLLGAAALTACADQDEQKRDVYASKQDCVKDWGDETKCDPAPAAAGQGRTHSGSGFFWGPMYSGAAHRWANSGTSSLSPVRSGSHAVGSSSISRGGFGSSASSHSSHSSGG